MDSRNLIYDGREVYSGDLAGLGQVVAGDGRYGASFELPATGQWELRLVAQVDEVTWQHSERLFVK